eukprot:scaffold2628_cov83-Cylindrotheca_fusiformis.AAC.1
MTFCAWCSQTKWYDRAIAFLFSALPGLVALSMTDMLSTQIGVAADSLIPIDRRWYLMVIASSTASLRAVNSAPNVDVWTDVCLLDFHVTGVLPTVASSP